VSALMHYNAGLNALMHYNAGLNALMHYKRLTKERKDALELASRQNWQLMQVEQERKRYVACLSVCALCVITYMRACACVGMPTL
jgi:hypothetical protein